MFFDRRASFIFLGIIITFSNAANILGIFPVQAKSHYATFEPLMIELAKRRHNVTVYTPFVGIESAELPNFHQINISVCFRNRFTNNVNVYEFAGEFGTFAFLKVLPIILPAYQDMLDCPAIRELLSAPSYSPGRRYDLLIWEPFFELFGLFADKFDIPHVSIFSSPPFAWLQARYANPFNPSYQTIFLESFDLSTVLGRARNTLSYVLGNYEYRRLFNERIESVFQQLRTGTVAKSLTLDRILSNSSLILTNSHFSLTGRNPALPTIVDIGGINIGPVRRLPYDIEKFINGSEHGVIYFCMGSLLRGSSFPEDKRNAFLYAFSKIPQRVLWKWEGDNLPGKPDNVMIAKWMPQRDILAHPNVKLFISHGGLLGTNEAVYEGVPILGIPIFGDQRTNVKSIEASGAGEMLDYNDISDEVVLGKIQKLLHDPKYRENAKELSRRYRDRPMSPLDTAVYWTEYVIRHKGAHHLRSAAVDLPWYQYLLLDVVAFVLLVLVLSLLFVYYTIKFTLRFIFKKLFGKQPTKSEKSKKKLN